MSACGVRIKRFEMWYWHILIQILERKFRLIIFEFWISELYFSKISTYFYCKKIDSAFERSSHGRDTLVIIIQNFSVSGFEFSFMRNCEYKNEDFVRQSVNGNYVRDEVLPIDQVSRNRLNFNWDCASRLSPEFTKKLFLTVVRIFSVKAKLTFCLEYCKIL